MATFDSIPIEILHLIFQHIDSAWYLGQCRLICKKWNAPAESAMLCKSVIITPRNTMPLLAYLTKKPSKAKLIKVLYLNIYTDDSSVTQLLKLALTPSIERIISLGEYIDDSILTMIHGILHESQQEFPNVKSIPAPSEFSDIYRKTLLLFKDSLETMCIPIDEESEHFAFNELADFTRLSKLTLSGYFDDMPHIDSILGKAHHLKDLVFDHCELDLYDDDRPTQQETLDWMKRKVEINQNAITVKLAEDTYPNYPLMEYLVYKYPNIKHLEVGKRFFQNGARHYERICRALSQIPSFTLKDQNNFESLLPHLKFFKGDKNVVKLMYIGQWQRKSYENDYGYHGYQGYYGYQSYYDDDDSTKRYSTLERRVDQDQQRITEAQINIFRTLHDPSAHNSHARRLEDITAFVTDLQVDLVQGYDDDDFASEDLDGVANLESEILFAALTYAHGLEKMKFRAHDIRTFKAAAPQPFYGIRRQLDSLEIVGANVDAGAFHCLNTRFHTINTLILSNCYVVTDETGTTAISLTSTKVGSLVIHTEKDANIGYYRFLDSPFGYRKKKKKKSKKPIDEIYVMLTLQGNKNATLKIQSGGFSVVPVSMDEYTNRLKTTTAFHISCWSLQHLELNMGDIHAKLDIAKHMGMLV